jgi:hypothetical protein
MGCNDRLMEPIHLHNDFNEERTVFYNYMKFKEGMERVFNQHIPLIPYFDLYWEYDA